MKVAVVHVWPWRFVRIGWLTQVVHGVYGFGSEVCSAPTPLGLTPLGLTPLALTPLAFSAVVCMPEFEFPKGLSNSIGDWARVVIALS